MEDRLYARSVDFDGPRVFDDREPQPFTRAHGLTLAALVVPFVALMYLVQAIVR